MFLAIRASYSLASREAGGFVEPTAATFVVALNRVDVVDLVVDLVDVDVDVEPVDVDLDGQKSDSCLHCGRT